MTRSPKRRPSSGDLLSIPEDILGPHALWIVSDCMACVHCANQDYPSAFQSLIKGYELSRSIGRTCNVAQWHFEVLNILESKGFVSEAINFDSELKHVLSSDNVYLKGVGLRCSALRRIERHECMKDVLSDFTKSERCLEKSGAQIQLARTRIALAKYYRTQGKEKESELYVEKASSFLSTIDRDVVPRDLLDFIPKEEKVGFMVERLTKINESLGSTRDVSSFLDRVLNVAMDFTLAMRGAFLIIEDNNLKTLASRNVEPSSFGLDDWRKVRNLLLQALRDGVELFDAEAEWKKLAPR